MYWFICAVGFEIFYFAPHFSTLSILALILSVLWLCSDISEHLFDGTVCLWCILSFHLEVKLFSWLFIIITKSTWSLPGGVWKAEELSSYTCKAVPVCQSGGIALTAWEGADAFAQWQFPLDLVCTLGAGLGTFIADVWETTIKPLSCLVFSLCELGSSLWLSYRHFQRFLCSLRD